MMRRREDTRPEPAGLGGFARKRAAALLSPVFLLAAIGLARAESQSVEIQGFSFKPARLTVEAGDKVTFINHDIAPHTATAGDKSWDTESLVNGAKADIEFAMPGTYTYICRFHPAMKAVIEVKPK
jgi:plastocyanin